VTGREGIDEHVDDDLLDDLGFDLVDEEILEPDDDESHRGGFGEFGGERSAFIERAFRERIVLVGVTLHGSTDEVTEESLDELHRLIDTAGADEVARVIQRRDTPDPATYIGKGKAEEVRRIAEAHDADTVVFDDELSPAQQVNLQKIFGRDALDRTAVILDIFAQNAHSQEGKAQVELAMLQYNLPRLRGAGKRLSQQAGGIGTRGPGETQLEVDRRRVVRRVHKLKDELIDVAKHRFTQSKRRRRSANRSVSLVGYTNAGKSTLLNRLTDAGVLVENRLFATLDATTRRLDLPGGEMVFLSDTVGFVRKLPHQLVEAFKSTLDVVIDADLLVHLVDASAAEPDAQIAAVRSVLRDIGAGERPELLVFNKSDLSDELPRLRRHHPDAVFISAVTGEGIDELLARLAEGVRTLTQVCELLVPFERGDVMAAVHREGQVLNETPAEGGMRYTARLEPASISRLSDFVVEVAS
jgi:GTP-binding protein HflX